MLIKCLKNCKETNRITQWWSRLQESKVDTEEESSPFSDTLEDVLVNISSFSLQISVVLGGKKKAFQLTEMSPPLLCRKKTACIALQVRPECGAASAFTFTPSLRSLPSRAIAAAAAAATPSPPTPHPPKPLGLYSLLLNRHGEGRWEAQMWPSPLG